MAYTPTNNPYIPGDPYSYDLKWMVEEVKKAQAVGEEASGSAEAAAASAEAAGDSAYNAATSASNALIFSQNAEASAENAADSAESAAGVVAPITQALNTQGQQISVLEGRMDTFASLTEGSTTADAELQDIRVGADGITYPTAGNAVREQVKTLADNIILSNSGEQTFKGLGNFQHYGISTEGSFITSQQYRVSNDDPMIFDRPINIRAKTGFRWGFILFSGTTAWKGWYTQATIPANTSFVLQIARVTEVTSEIADINEFLSAITFDTEIGQQVNSMDPAVKSYSSTDFVNGVWENGSISSWNARLASAILYPVRSGNKFAYTLGAGLDIFLVVYDADDMSIKYQSGWITPTDPQEYIFETDGLFAVQFKKTNGENIPVSELTGTYVLTYGIIDALEYSIENIGYDPRPYSYIGEKIPSKINRYDAENIFTMSYSNMTAQDIDVYGDYMFVAFSGTEMILVYSLSSNSLVASMNVETAHGSSMQFSKEYYDAADEFPLLYVGGWTSNRINVIRITRSENEWNATVVRTLYIPTQYGYFASPSIDADNNILLTYAHSNPTIPNADTMIIAAWDLDSLTNNGDGTFTPKLIDSCTSPSVGTFQGHKYYGGRIYLTAANSGAPYNQKMYAIDCGSGELVTTIDLSNILTTETEGLCYRIVGNDITWYISEYYKVFKLTF